MKTTLIAGLAALVAFQCAEASSCPANDIGCGCSWATSQTCGLDDGSACWCRCCCPIGGVCGGGPSPPTPPPNTPTLYCPAANDFVVAYGGPQVFDQGWQTQGGGGVATKAAFNLNGGYVEYDVNLSGVRTGVNANIYTISPGNLNNGTGFTGDKYCDGAVNDKYVVTRV